MGRVSGVILVVWDARSVLYCRYFIDGWLFGGREVFVWGGEGGVTGVQTDLHQHLLHRAHLSL